MKNAYIVTVLSFLFRSWFWLGIWLLYYLQFTNYAGVGLLESVMIITSTGAEIPTGALADLIGKRGTLLLTFLIGGVGNMLMGLAPSFLILGFSVFVITLSDALYSGSLEALLFDSLKEDGKEELFGTWIARVNTGGLVGSAVASVVGGFLFTIDTSLPFFAVTGVYLVGLVFTFLVKEPSVDTEVFSWNGYITQTKQGFFQLFKSSSVRYQSLLLIATGAFSMVAYHILVDSLLVEYSFQGQQLGILIAASFLVSAIVSQMTSFLLSTFSRLNLIFLLSIGLGIAFVLMGMAHLWWGAMMVMIFASINTMYGNVSSVMVNHTTHSKFRATTVSTLAMLKNLPYVLSAFFLGALMDIYSAKVISIVLGVTLICVTAGFVSCVARYQES